MSGLFEVTPKDIERLSDFQLTKLLQLLLLQEVQALGLPKVKVSVGLTINIPDGGEDGCLEWKDGPAPSISNWIARRLTVFQAKATTMTPAACGNEVQIDKKTALKPKVARVVENQGSYILFYGKSCEHTAPDERIKQIRQAFESHYSKKEAELVDIKIFGSEKISIWVNEHPSVVIYVLSCNGRPIPSSFQSWDDWNDEHPSELNFYKDKSRESIITTLQSELCKEGSVVRLAALSGLGKTRLALEAFRPPEDSELNPEQAALSGSCIYIQDGESNSSELVATVRSLSKSNVHGCLIIDECPLSLHRDLSNIVTKRDSKLSLLTLDFDPDSDPRKSNQTFIGLEPIPDDDMVELLKNSRAKLPDEYIERIASFVQGYPRMAEFLVGALRLGEPKLWELAPTDLYKKLIQRRSASPILTTQIAQALSIFEHIGVEGDVEYQLDEFASKICNLEKSIVSYELRDLEKARIVYKRGDYIRITPLPLAVALAADWWDHCHESVARSLLSGELVPPDMLDATTNQLSRLRGHTRVDGLVTAMFGPTSPFRKRDRLDSATGSRLVSSLAEVAPKAVCDTLKVAFRDIPLNELEQLGPGRRNLIWCLEKLCWWPETFFDSASLLLKFAASETMATGNNATRQFLQLFHVYLSGTELPAIERLRVIQTHLSSPEPAIQRMAILGASEAFMSHWFQRTSGVESQGGGIPRSDWRPKSHEEILNYWVATLKIITPYLTKNDELGVIVRSKLADNTRGLIASGGFDIVNNAVKIYRTSGNPEWLDMLNALRETVNYDSEAYPAELQVNISSLITQLEPSTIESKLLHIVSRPTWSEIKETAPGKLIVMAEERAKAFAVDISTDISIIFPILSQLLSSEQRQTYLFGSVLAEHVTNPLELLDASVAQLKSISPKERNPSFIMGLISTIPDQFRDELKIYLKNLLLNIDTKDMAVDFIRSMRPEDDEIKEIIKLLASKKLTAWQVGPFAWGRALENTSDKVVGELVMACASQGDEGALVAIDILGMHIHGKAMSPELAPPATHLVLIPNLLSTSAARSGNYDHVFETVAHKLLVFGPDNDNFFIDLCQRLLEGAGNGLNRSPAINNLLNEILINKMDLVWPILQNFLHTAKDEQIQNLRWVFRHSPNSGLDLIEMIGVDRILTLCGIDPTVSKWAITLAKPLRDPVPEARFPSWNDLVILLLDKFGSDPEVRSAIYTNLFTGVWSGSRIPRLEQEKVAFTELCSHPNTDVSAWAAELVGHLEIEVTRERKREQEREFGIWK